MSANNTKKVANTNASIAEKGKEAALKAVENTREATDKVVSMSSEAVKGFWESGAKEWRNTQEKALSFGRETSRTLSKGSDSFAKNFAEAVELTREHAEAAVESSNVAADYTRKLAEEVYGFANKSFASNLEHSKELFSCRTLNDVIELQSKAFQKNVDAFFSQSVKLSDLLFKLSTEVVEPVQTRASQTADSLNRKLSAA